jgi:uncharacterized membrane protein YkvI
MLLAGCVGINKGRECYRSFFFVGFGALAFVPWFAILVGMLSDSQYRTTVGLPVFLTGALLTALYLGFAIFRNSILPRKEQDMPEY